MGKIIQVDEDVLREAIEKEVVLLVSDTSLEPAMPSLAASLASFVLRRIASNPSRS